MVVVAASALLLFWRLGQNSLAAWDEAIYAQVSKEILSSGDWITLHWGYKPWFEKPPLLMWITAIFFRWFGVDEFWSRAASALSGVGVTALTYLLGKQIYDRAVGFGAAVILLSSLQFVRGARFGTTDVMLTFFVYAAFYGYIRSWEGDSRWWYLTWLGIALAVMTKGAGAFIAPMVIAGCVLSRRAASRTLGSRDFLLGLLLALLVVAPWHVAAYLRHGDAFIESYIGYHVLGRSVRSLGDHTGGPFFYLDTLSRNFFPWFFLSPFAVALAVRENVVKISKSLVLLAAVVLVYGVYTLVKTKLDWYIIPVYPSLAILISAMIRASIHSHRGVAHAGLLTALPVIILSLQDHLVQLLILSAAIIGLAAAALMAVGKERRQAGVAVCTAVLFLFVGFGSIRPTLVDDGWSSVAEIGKAAGEDGNDRSSVIIYSGLGWPCYLFYSSRPVVVASSEADISGILARNASKTIILKKEDLSLIASRFGIQIVAERGPYIYARIRAGQTG